MNKRKALTWLGAGLSWGLPGIASQDAGAQWANLGFTVAFITERRATAKAGGGLTGSGFGGRSTAKMALQGLSDADLQAATNLAYEHYKKEIGAAGIKLADRASLMQAMDANYKPISTGEQREVIFSRQESAIARVFAPSEHGSPVLMREWSESLIGSGMSNTSHIVWSSMSAQAYAKKTGVPVVSVLLVIDFADAETYGGFHRNTSAVSVSSALAALAKMSRIDIYRADGRIASTVLPEPVAFAGNFGALVETTSSAHKSGETVANVFGALTGGGTNSTKNYALQAQPAAWKDAMDQLSRDALRRLMSSMPK
jgi:hypothetical protein